MTKITASSKQLEALATNWRHKLRTDVFFRTEFTVICIFVCLCIANIFIVVVSLRQLHMDVAASVITILTDAITLSSTAQISATTTSQLILTNIKGISSANIAIVTISSLFVTLFLGYIAARVALKPTKNALAAQKQFIGNIAHELRTPLSIIKANSEILLLQKGIHGETSELVSSNLEELDRISGIINNLLTLNSFRNSKTMEFELIDLSEVVRNSLQKFEKMAADRRVVLEARLDDPLKILANKSGLIQIIMNVVKNALIYSKPEGVVFVTTRASSGMATFEVRDTGIGIDPNNIERIFEPYYQVESSRSQNKGSGGLGLAIVSEMVKFHHGKISIQSKPNVGTIVKVDFPLKHELGSSSTKDSASQGGLTLDFSQGT